MKAITYFLLSRTMRRVKIGKSTNVVKRVEALKTGCPDEDVMLLGTIAEPEATVHAKFHALRIHGEWFHFEGALKHFCVQTFGVSISLRATKKRPVTLEEFVTVFEHTLEAPIYSVMGSRERALNLCEDYEEMLWNKLDELEKAEIDEAEEQAEVEGLVAEWCEDIGVITTRVCDFVALFLGDFVAASIKQAQCIHLTLAYRLPHEKTLKVMLSELCNVIDEVDDRLNEVAALHLCFVNPQTLDVMTWCPYLTTVEEIDRLLEAARNLQGAPAGHCY